MWYQTMSDSQRELEHLMRQFGAVYPPQVVAAIVAIVHAACATDLDESIRRERIALRELTAYGQDTCRKPRWWSRQAIMLRDLERRSLPYWAALLHLARHGYIADLRDMLTHDITAYLKSKGCAPLIATEIRSETHEAHA